MTTYRICDTPMLMVLASDAVAAGYNRQLDLNELAAVIDPNGTHVCYFSMIHEHIAGRKVKPHMRTLWMLKLRNKPTTDPSKVSLDISMDSFNKLQIHDTKAEANER